MKSMEALQFILKKMRLALVGKSYEVREQMENTKKLKLKQSFWVV